MSAGWPSLVRRSAEDRFDLVGLRGFESRPRRRGLSVNTNPISAKDFYRFEREWDLGMKWKLKSLEISQVLKRGG